MKDNSDWQRFATPLGLIRLVLLVDWDPIGIFGIEDAMDEYDRYAVEVYDLLRKGAAKREIAEYLRGIEKQRMGMRGCADLEAVVNKLWEAYQDSQGEAEPPAA